MIKRFASEYLTGFHIPNLFKGSISKVRSEGTKKFEENNHFWLLFAVVHKSLRIFSARHWLFVWISIFKKKTISQKIRYSCISDLPGLEEFIRFPVSRFLIWNRQEFNTADYKFRKAHYCHELLIRQELTWRRGAHRTTGVEAFRSLQLFRSKITKNANDQSPIKDLSIYIGIFMNGGVEFTCL